MKNKLISYLKYIFIRIKKRLIFKKQVVTLKPPAVKRGNVLISYIISPFIGKEIPISNSHTNEWECYKIVNLFLESGYEVDVIEFSNSTFLPKKKYSYFLDIHSNIERLTPYLNKDCIKILHITGAHWLFQNSAEYLRLLELQKRKKITLMPRRMARPCLGIENCNVASILGNKFTESTFLYANKPIYRIHISSTIQFEFNENKNFEKCKRNFLWFGGAGMVLKGLDVTLEAFAEMPDFTLYIVGPVTSEPDFVELYKNELYHLSNIKTLGWLSVDSEEFVNVLNDCVGIILPSCSEGGGGSVITGLHAGLLPIVSYEASVDIFDFGITLNKIVVRDIQDAIKTIANKPVSELKKMSYAAWSHARKYHTRENFENEYRLFLKNTVHI